MSRPRTLGELKATGHRYRSVKEELRDNVIARLRARQRQLESEVAARHPALCQWLARAGMDHERRILRLPIGRLSWHYPEPDILQLEFVLPAGCFATVVVRELVDLVPAGQTDSPCVF